MDPFGSEIGIGGRIPSDALPQSFEFAFTDVGQALALGAPGRLGVQVDGDLELGSRAFREPAREGDRKSTRLNSSHGYISYAVFCLKKKKPVLDCTIRRTGQLTCD